MDYASLIDHELSAVVAEKIAGWSNVHFNGPIDRLANKCYGRSPSLDYQTEIPAYASDIAAAIGVEDLIAELDLGAEYADELKGVVTADWKGLDISPGLFGLIHATPRQRCLASLRATEQRDAQAIDNDSGKS